jgi:hypothetical protein
MAAFFALGAVALTGAAAIQLAPGLRAKRKAIAEPALATEILEQ